MARSTKAVAKRPATNNQDVIPADMMNDVVNDAGAGMEAMTQDDMIIPFVAIIQSLSPQTKKNKPEYIEGAAEGMIFNTATQELLDIRRDDGTPVRFVPCAYQRRYTEWIPRADGGGFVGEHGPEIMDQTERDGSKNKLPNGNEVVAAGVWFLLLLRDDGGYERVVVSMSSSQMKKSRQLATRLSSFTIPRPDGNGRFTPPLFFHVIEATTKPESNDQGDWMGWAFERVGSVFEVVQDGANEIYSEAKEFGRLAREGVVKADVSRSDGSGVDVEEGRSDNVGDDVLDDDIPF